MIAISEIAVLFIGIWLICFTAMLLHPGESDVKGKILIWISQLPEHSADSFSVAGASLGICGIALTLFIATSVGKSSSNTLFEQAHGMVLNGFTALLALISGAICVMLIGFTGWPNSGSFADVVVAVLSAITCGVLAALSFTDVAVYERNLGILREKEFHIEAKMSELEVPSICQGKSNAIAKKVGMNVPFIILGPICGGLLMAYAFFPIWSTRWWVVLVLSTAGLAIWQVVLARVSVKPRLFPVSMPIERWSELLAACLLGFMCAVMIGITAILLSCYLVSGLLAVLSFLPAVFLVTISRNTTHRTALIQKMLESAKKNISKRIFNLEELIHRQRELRTPLLR